MTVQHHNADQGSDEWHELRCGKLTASNVSSVVTPTLKVSANDTTRALANKVAIERITGISEEGFTSEKMLRGHIDEDIARGIYAKKYAPVSEVGFITNDAYSNFGYSPDGLVGNDGLIEIKSRDPHLQLATIMSVERGEGIPKEYRAQVQAGLLLSGREWLDFISFSCGLPMLVHRVYPDANWQSAIKEAAAGFEQAVCKIIAEYEAAVSNPEHYTPTERINYEDMIL